MLYAPLLLIGILQTTAYAPRSNERHSWYPECGISKYSDGGTPFVVAGKDARPHEFPWTVSMRYSEDPSDHFCGGCLITPEWVLTVAHCVYGVDPSWYVISVGEHNVTEGSNSSAVHVKVAKHIWHDKYDKNTFDNDIALTKLQEAVQLNDDIRTVCAPVEDANYTGKDCQVAGWGTVKPGAWKDPDVLQWVSLKVIPDDECSAVMPILEGMMCAIYGKGDERSACQVDSGGPLTVKNDDRKFELAGLVSWGYECIGGYPGVYTKVQTYLDWIENTMKAN